MASYQHDMMHCSQDECKKKDKCFRYWLGKNFKEHGFQYAGFYLPEKPVTKGCEYFSNI